MLPPLVTKTKTLCIIALYKSSTTWEYDNLVYPSMTYRDYIRKFAKNTWEGRFYCEICTAWIDKHRWLHFKTLHRYGGLKT